MYNRYIQIRNRDRDLLDMYNKIGKLDQRTQEQKGNSKGSMKQFFRSRKQCEK